MLDYLCHLMNLGWYEHMWKQRSITSSKLFMCVKLMNNSHLARAYWIKLFTQHPTTSTLHSLFCLFCPPCLAILILCPSNEQVCFICKKKKQFWCVRCKVAFHSKCSPWSDSMLQLKDHPEHTVCWRHLSDWRLDRKVNFFFSP